jgi:hypothetical protein
MVHSARGEDIKASAIDAEMLNQQILYTEL